jgi:hypothetical protein
MAVSFFGIPLVIWGAIFLGIAVLWALVNPKPARPELGVGLRGFLLRWGHALCWLMLALSSFVRGFWPELNGTANVLAFGALVSYVGFVGALLRNR